VAGPGRIAAFRREQPRYLDQGLGTAEAKELLAAIVGSCIRPAIPGSRPWLRAMVDPDMVLC
jgi:hypothetical protein